jgi:putative FmdB family regulatory protein
MPTYDYKCKACGHRLEIFQSMTESPKRKCPHCGKNALERLIGTGAAILFKGSGFYQTDYRSDSYKKAAEADKPAGESKAESKDAKTASTTEAKSSPDKSKTEPKPASPPPAPPPKEKKPKAKT